MKNPIIDLNELNFEAEVLNSSEPVLVHFWAGWSARCMALSSVLESLAEDDSLSIKICRVDVEAQEELTGQCDVRVAPTLLVFNLGMVTARNEGVATDKTVRDILHGVPWVSNRRHAVEMLSL